MTGWIYIVGAIVTIAAVAVDWQVVLPQITSRAPVLRHVRGRGGHLHEGRSPERSPSRGDPHRHHHDDQHARRQADVADQQRRRDRRTDRRRRILVILLLFNAHHGPQIIFHSYGFGAGHPWGYFGALLVGGLLSAYVMYGFDTAGTLAEETNDPRKQRPTGDHPRDRGGRGHRRSRDPVRVDGEQAHPRQERRTSRPALRDEAGVRKHHRQHLPGRLRARDLRLLPRRSGGDDPDAVLDVARQQAAVRLAGRARVRTRQGARHPRAPDRHPRGRAAGDQRR